MTTSPKADDTWFQAQMAVLGILEENWKILPEDEPQVG